MRDIEELRELRKYDAGAPPLDDATRSRVRGRLFAAMASDDEPAPAVRHRRPVLRIALTGVVAAAVAGGVLVAEQDGSSGARQTAAPPTAGSPLMVNVSAQRVLNGAAAYARQHEKVATPRDDQFIYTREIIKETDETGTTKSYTDENWRSVDGSKPSWVMEVGKGWWSPPLKNGESEWPPTDWDELKMLPTDPTQLIIRLDPDSGATATPTAGTAQNSSDAPPSTDATALPDGGKELLDRITDRNWSLIHFQLAGLLEVVPVMPEGLRSAAYEALGMVPGAKVVPNQKDAEGRTGVAIGYEEPDADGTNRTSYLIFDPKTYEFLGLRLEFDSDGAEHGDKSTQLSCLVTWAVVDRAKQRP